MTTEVGGMASFPEADVAVDLDASAWREFRHGWPLVLAAGLGTGVAAINFYSMGVFVQPLQAAFGWSRGFVTSALTIYAVVSVILAGFVGYAIDKFGPRRIALPGLVVFCLLFASLGLCGGSKVAWVAQWILLAIGGSTIKPTVWSVAIVGRFHRARGLALALALTGGAVSAFVGPILGSWLIDTHGWQTGYFGIAALCLIVTLPLCVWGFYGADDLHRRRGTSPAVIKAAVGAEPLAVTLRSPPFLKLAVATFLLVFTTTGTVVHVVPLLTGAGLGRGQAAGMAGIVGIAGVAGRLATGSLFDRVDGRVIGATIALLPVIAFVALLFVNGSVLFAYLAVVVLGLCAGAEIEMAAFLSSRFFAPANYGTLFGVIVGMITLGAGVGPTVAGVVYDYTQSYRMALIGAVPLTILASLLIARLGPYPSETTPDA
ncbi:MAG: transporter [Sphingomonas bacterium]|nr:transporter [Sphingomonas bacterium]